MLFSFGLYSKETVVHSYALSRLAEEDSGYLKKPTSFSVFADEQHDHEGKD